MKFFEFFLTFSTLIYQILSYRKIGLPGRRLFKNLKKYSDKNKSITLLLGICRTSSHSTGGGIGSSRDQNCSHWMRRMESHKEICRYGSFQRRSFLQLTMHDQLQETAKFKGQLFADPTRKLYHALGMDIENLDRTPKGQPRPSYLLLGSISSTIQSIWVNIHAYPRASES